MIDKLEMFIASGREQHFGPRADPVAWTSPSLRRSKLLVDQFGGDAGLARIRFQGLTARGSSAFWNGARQIVGDTRTMREEMRAGPTRPVRQPASGR